MKEIKKVVIVGGGSSAMLATAFISNNTNYEITVIDKPGGSPIGVGEATLLNFKPFMDSCGFNFKEWFDACDATYKTGILFPGWTSKKEVWHPFIMHPYENTPIENFDKNNDNGFHIDCIKLAKFIKEKIKHKVTFIEDTVQFQSENYVQCENNKIYADVFIDCTGFKSLLHQTDKVDLSKRLICDTAIAGHVEYENEEEKRKYVICEAVSCGWIWKIPVRHRIGTGIVFNRRITSVEEAAMVFTNHWKDRVKIRKTIDWTPYYKLKPWKNNVIAIGLSAGFIEPLESTGLALAMEGAYQFVVLTESGYMKQSTRSLYNSILTSFFEESIDFVAMHYLINERKEKIWQEGRRLKKPIQIDYYNKRLKDPLHYKDSQYSFFGGSNWVTWLRQT
ncbi:MAG: hypothetical protein CBC16_10075 [Verrucomicrobia bacterium TMED56]|jgi:flavin-dependent dehydrogenase|nr:hypothetical protein [Marinovum sp.]OUU36479.1 MAG: hypothetical protein CBC16_10075 [Verrucomicrobia bacterium TMED56]|tara:strand:- start:142 stop:1317 length:1176 start_codon:yes stop_codon:yes gene_type:complete